MLPARCRHSGSVVFIQIRVWEPPQARPTRMLRESRRQVRFLSGFDVMTGGAGELPVFRLVGNLRPFSIEVCRSRSRRQLSANRRIKCFYWNGCEFSVNAVGSEPISYQWRFDGNDIPPAPRLSRSKTLKLVGRKLLRCGEHVQGSSVLSRAATSPQCRRRFILQPKLGAVRPTEHRRNSRIVAEGTTPIFYQWKAQWG